MNSILTGFRIILTLYKTELSKWLQITSQVRYSMLFIKMSYANAMRFVLFFKYYLFQRNMSKFSLVWHKIIGIGY